MIVRQAIYELKDGTFMTDCHLEAMSTIMPSTQMIQADPHKVCSYDTVSLPPQKGFQLENQGQNQFGAQFGSLVNAVPWRQILPRDDSRTSHESDHRAKPTKVSLFPDGQGRRNVEPYGDKAGKTRQTPRNLKPLQNSPPVLPENLCLNCCAKARSITNKPL